MKAEKYLNKIENKIGKELAKKGISSDYIVDGRLEGRVPIATLLYPNGSTHEYNLANEYITYIEEDVSVSESFRSKKCDIFRDIEEFQRSRTFEVGDDKENEEEEDWRNMLDELE